MKKSKKIWVKTAGVCIGAGVLLSFFALAAEGFDLSKFSTDNVKTDTCEIKEELKKIAVDTLDVDVRFELSQDANCRVTSVLDEKDGILVEAKDGTLTIVQKRSGSLWDHIHFGFYMEETGITVYLPRKEYESLEITGDSGDVDISEEVTFLDVDIQGASGEVSFKGNVKNGMKIQTASGEVSLENCEAGDIVIETASGDVSLEDSNAGNLAIETASGDVSLEDSDAGNLTIETASGDVSGSLLSDKIFDVDTKSGEVKLPDSSAGGKCRVQTASGDIRFKIRYGKS